MKTITDARRALHRASRIVDNAPLHTTTVPEGQSIIKFDGVLLEPCDAMKLSEYLDTIREYLDETV